MNYWLCKYYFGRHKKKLIATNNEFEQHVTGIGGDQWVENFVLRFYLCDNCETRWVKVIGAKGPFYGYKSHAGIMTAIENWKDAGVLPSGSILFNKEYYQKQLEVLENLADD